jgi:hypothetical protein
MGCMAYIGTIGTHHYETCVFLTAWGRLIFSLDYNFHVTGSTRQVYSYSAGKDMACISLNTKVHYALHKM